MRRWQLVALALVILAVAAGAVLVVLFDWPNAGTTATPTATGSPLPTISPLPSAQPRPPVLTSLPPDAPPPAGRSISAMLRPLLKPSQLGDLHGLVADAATGRVLFDDDGTVAAPPASTTKLLTAYAALHVLPPDATLDTTVIRSGQTLYLVGGGDMTLAEKPTRDYPPSATLRRLAALTAAAVPDPPRNGFRLRYDASGWRGPDTAPGWQPDYLTAGDVSRLSPLEVDEGRIVSTQVARVDDPARQAATAFATELGRAGLDIVGAPQPGSAPDASAPIAEISSAPITELVHRMLTVSDNELAESLGRAVAAATERAPSFAGEAAAVVAALHAGGIPTGHLHLYDASGLSRLDRIAPTTLVAVLRQSTTDPVLGPLMTGLPVGGATGTLTDRYRDQAVAPAAGLVRAKTGTLTGDSALAGYVVDRDGRLLVFALLAERAPATDPAEAALDRIVARLASCGCRRPT